MKISGKTIVITGGASGLGAATAQRLSLQGAKTILLDRNLPLLQKIANKIKGMAFECDVTSETDVKNIISSLSEIHAVINCAGVVQGARIFGKQGAMSLHDFSTVIQINLLGTFNVMRLAAEKMSTQKSMNENEERGVIINTASIAAFEGQLGQVAYAASKGGVVSMTLPAARELSRFGIRVMTIAPGVMETPMMAGMTDATRFGLCADVPFPKTPGNPDDFASLVQHILENSYLNGSTIRLDGALRLR